MRVFLLTELIRRDLSSRFAGSFGGLFWAVFNPLIQCALYGMVFSLFLRVRPPDGFPGGYLEFLLAGLLPWLGFQEALQRGAGSVNDQGHLVKKLRFPVHLLVFSSVGSALLLQLVSVIVLIVYALAAGTLALDPALLALAFLFEIALVVGPVLVLSALSVFFRDLAQLLPPALMVAFYLTPILYPEDLIPKSMTPWLSANPLRELVALFRAALFGMPAPDLLRVAGWMVAFVVLGFFAKRLFGRLESSFSDLM